MRDRRSIETGCRLLESAAVDPFLDILDDLLVAATPRQRLPFGLSNNFDFIRHLFPHGEYTFRPDEKPFLEHSGS
jgi:hypothetical protein